MERYKIYSPLTDKELVQKAYWWIEQLVKSGGNNFVMHVPAQLDHDTDLVFFNLAKRFDNLLDKYAALQAKCERYENALKEIENVHAYPNVVARKALSGEGEKEPTEEEKFDKWVKENATQLEESHWLIGYKHIHGKSDLIRVYNRFKDEDKQ